MLRRRIFQRAPEGVTGIHSKEDDMSCRMCNDANPCPECLEEKIERRIEELAKKGEFHFFEVNICPRCGFSENPHEVNYDIYKSHKNLYEGYLKGAGIFYVPCVEC